MKSRLHLPTLEFMSDEQRAIHDDVLLTRGNVHGPFLAWLVSPALAGPAQRLGAFCRYGTSLSLQESELLILHVAAHFDCVGEQQIHEPIALREGLSEASVCAIRSREAPQLEEPRLRTLSRLARQLLETNRLSPDLYAQAVAQLGEATLVEVVAVIGYYALVAYTLNAFEMRLV